MLFFVIEQVFRILSFFSQIFRIFATLYMLNVVYDPFLTRKNTIFYSVHTFARIRQNYFSKLLLKILGGRMHGPSSTSNFGVGTTRTL